MTDGTTELIKLAELLRLGLKTTRDIARLRPTDYTRLMQIAERAEEMACELDEIVGSSPQKLQ